MSRGRITARRDGEELSGNTEAPEFESLPTATMDHARRRFLRLAEETLHPDWLFLTKLPENVMRRVPEHWQKGFPAHVRMRVGGEDRKRPTDGVAHLWTIPSKVRFVDCNSMTGSVDPTALTRGAGGCLPTTCPPLARHFQHKV